MITIFICKQEICDCVNSYMNFYYSIFAGVPQLAGTPLERKGKERNGITTLKVQAVLELSIKTICCVFDQ